VLDEVPLHALPAGIRLQCGLGLLAMLVTVQWSLTKSEDMHRADEVEGMVHRVSAESHLCSLVIQMLDNSVGTGIFTSVTPTLLLQSLTRLAIQVKQMCLSFFVQ
jgi:hypothetical protein